MVITGDRDGQVYAWHLVTPAAAPASPEPPAGAAAAPASSSEATCIKVPLIGHGDAAVRCCCISADGRSAVSGDEGGVACVWSLPGGQLLAQLAAPGAAAGQPLSSIAMSADGQTVLTGSKSGRVVVWRAGPGAGEWRATELPQKHAEGAKVHAVAISPDCSLAASAGDDSKVRRAAPLCGACPPGSRPETARRRILRLPSSCAQPPSRSQPRAQPPAARPQAVTSACLPCCRPAGPAVEPQQPHADHGGQRAHARGALGQLLARWQLPGHLRRGLAAAGAEDCHHAGEFVGAGPCLIGRCVWFVGAVVAVDWPLLLVSGWWGRD